MKNLVLATALLLSTAAVAQTSSAKTTATQAKPVVFLSPEQFKAQLAKQPGQLIDVRTPDEVKKGYIAGARVINFLDRNYREQFSGLDKAKPVYLYCASGGRSEDAGLLLQEMGFPQVYSLKGGYSDLVKAGMPAETPEKK